MGSKRLKVPNNTQPVASIFAQNGVRRQFHGNASGFHFSYYYNFFLTPILCEKFLMVVCLVRLCVAETSPYYEYLSYQSVFRVFFFLNFSLLVEC